MGKGRDMSLYAVVDPATGDVVQEYPTTTDEQMAQALAAAVKAHREWGRTSTLAERAALIKQVAKLHTERRDELAKIIQREMGKPLDQALGEVDFSAAIYEYYADNAEKFLADEPIDLLGGEGSALIRRSPVGVLIGIMPWNYPYYQVARFAGPNLTLGNTILLKHAPQCPESAAAIQQIFTDAGYPEGAYLNVYATNEQIAAAIADPRVQGVSLTSSERAGAAVAEIAGRNLKKVVLETRLLSRHRPPTPTRTSRTALIRLPRRADGEGVVIVGFPARQPRHVLLRRRRQAELPTKAQQVNLRVPHRRKRRVHLRQTRLRVRDRQALSPNPVQRLHVRSPCLAESRERRLILTLQQIQALQ